MSRLTFQIDTALVLIVILFFSNNMKKLKFTNLEVFIIFFGIALIEAFQKQNWLEAVLFLALGLLSLRADMQKGS